MKDQQTTEMPYDNTNSGAAFPKNSANPKAPKYSGTLNVEGKDFEIAIWDKISKQGKPFLSLSVKPKGNYSEDVNF